MDHIAKWNEGIWKQINEQPTDYIFGTDWFNELAARLHVPTDDIEAVKLIFVTGEHARIEIRHVDGRSSEKVLQLFGIERVKIALGLPHTAVKITIESRAGDWLKVNYEYEYAPFSGSVLKVADLLLGQSAVEERP